jgi:hypothetical protein
VGPRTGLDAVYGRKILSLPSLELRLLGRPACSQTLSRVRDILDTPVNDVVSSTAVG